MKIITADLARANVQAYKESNIGKFEEEHESTIENISKAIGEASLLGLTKVELPFVLLEKNIQEFIDYLKHFGYDASFEQEAGASGYNTCFSQEYGGVEKLINIGEIARRGNLVISWKDEVQNIKETKRMV